MGDKDVPGHHEGSKVGYVELVFDVYAYVDDEADEGEEETGGDEGEAEAGQIAREGEEEQHDRPGDVGR